jgi:alpha-beta hydrolase superfamily lysophospholipase
MAAVIVLCWGVLFCLAPSAMAVEARQEGPDSPRGPEATNETQNSPSVRLLPKPKFVGPVGVFYKMFALGSKPLYPTGHIYALDDTPLGGRTPLLILPGRAQESHRNAWWEKVVKLGHDTPGFDQHYKPYVYLFNSRTQLGEMTDTLLSALEQWHPAVGGRPWVVVSYSVGGMILEEAWQRSAHFRENTLSAFAIAVPFNGSPVFNASWTIHEAFAKPIPSEYRLFTRKWSDAMGLRGYLVGRNNLVRMMHWNNVDGTLPPQYRSNNPELVPPDAREQSATSTRTYYQALKAKRQGVTSIETTQALAHTQSLKQHLTIYASYLPNQVVKPQLPRTRRKLRQQRIVGTLLLPVRLPVMLINTVVPAYGVNVHLAFRFGNKAIAAMRTGPNSPPDQASVFQYNDGLLPLSSALYLPERPEAPYTESIPELVRLSGVCRVRVFENADHVDLGNYRLNVKSLRTQDVLDPDHRAQTSTHWLLEDLVTQATQLQGSGQLRCQ